MSRPPEQFDSPSHLRISDDVPSSRVFWLRSAAFAWGTLAATIAVAPLIFLPFNRVDQISTYLVGLGVLVGLDVSVVAVMLTWRSFTRSRLGEWQFTIDGYQSSLLRNLLLGGGMHLLALFLLWIPFLATGEGKQGPAPFALFLIMASFAAVISLPWLVQFALNVKGHDLEIHQEGIIIGGFYPCRWERIVAYQVWDDACAFITIDIRGRGPFEAFMSPIDRRLLLEELQEHVGPPSSMGRSDDLPDGDRDGQTGQLSIFR